MTVPYWIKQELALIHPQYFAVYDERPRQYQIRKWNSRYPRPRTWRTDSDLICKVAYDKLDYRILFDLKRGLYNARRAKEIMLEVDRANAHIMEEADKELEYVSRYMAKRIWSYYKEPTVFGGLKNTTDRRWKH